MKKRESFNSRWGFILACIGSAVGMGNIWMFPTRVSLYGGGSFLIPYFLFVALIGFTGVSGEMSFGRATRSGPVDAFGFACETKGKRKAGEALGLIPVLGSLAMAIGYTVVMGWIFRYMIGTFTGKTLSAVSVEDFAGAFESMASAFGNNFWQIVALVVAMVILAFGVGKGIEKVNKVLMPVFFLLFVALGIYVAFQPGAADGYRYIFRVEPKALADPKTWIFALGQAFFSLSVAGNGTLIYGSYLSDGENIPAAAGRVAFFDTLAAMLAALVIIPAMATTGAQLNTGGPGLLFIFLPNLIKSMPGGALIAIVFFVAVFFAGLTSLINLYEAPIATVQEKISSRKSSSLRCDRGYRCGRISSDPGHCIPVDGCSVDLHLPARRRPCRSHVLLDLRKEVCAVPGRQGKKQQIHGSVLSDLQIYLRADLCAGSDSRNRAGWNRLKRC